MSIEPKVYRASTADVPALAPLFDAYRVFYGNPSDVTLAEQFLRARLEAEESVVFFCRYPPSGTVAGFTQLYPLFSSICAGSIWVLNDLFVAPGARRLGVGQTLLQAAHDHARKTGAWRVVLSTARANRAARALYESVGYVQDDGFCAYSFTLRNLP